MLKTIVAAIAIGLLSAGIALAQTNRLPSPATPVGHALILVKHDKDGDGPGRGRKLGHYKNRGAEVEDEDNDENGDRRSRTTTTTTTTTTTRGWVNPAPYSPYEQMPGYGYSAPPGYYDYYGRPYYRGY